MRGREQVEKILERWRYTLERREMKKISTHFYRLSRHHDLFLHLHHIGCGACLHSGESVISVSGEEGSTAVLNCKLPNVDTETHIRWSTKSEIVFERKGKGFAAAKGYEDRVDVPEEELRKGNFSLVLRNLKLDDRNVYICSYKVRLYKRDTDVNTAFKEISSVSLSVREKPPEEKSDEVPSPTGDAQMKFPHPLILVLSLLACVLFQFFF